MPGNSAGSLKFPTFMHKLHAACLKKNKNKYITRITRSIKWGKLNIIRRMTKQFEIVSHISKSIYGNFSVVQKIKFFKSKLHCHHNHNILLKS